MPALEPYPSYRDSGIPWLREVPTHWELQKLRHILRSTSKRYRPDLPLLSVVREKGVIVRDISNKDENHNVVPDDLTNYKVVEKFQFAMNKMKAWQGSYGVSEHIGIVSPAYFVFYIRSVGPSYFHRAIRSRAYIPYFARASDGVRVGQWDLSTNAMREIPFLAPSFHEQTCIVRFLDHADRRIQRYIRAKQKLISLLTEQKQAIIHQAVTGRIDVRTGQPYPVYKPSGVEWLGDVPTHWGILPGRTCFREKKEANLALQVKTVLSLSYGQIVVKPPEKLHGLVPSSFETYQVVDPLNIVIRPIDLQNDKNSLRFGLSKHRGIITSAYLCFLTSNRLVSEYGHLLLHSYDLMKIFYGLGSGLRQNLNWTDFKYLPCTVPPPPEQNAIVEFLDASAASMDDGIARVQREINLLHEYRTRLIADVVTGKLDVREAATTLPEVDPLADEDTPGDTLDTGSESDIDELDVIPEEAEA